MKTICKTTPTEFNTIRHIEEIYKSTLSLEVCDNEYEEEMFYDEENDEYVDFVEGIEYLQELIACDNAELFYEKTNLIERTVWDGLLKDLNLYKEAL